MEDNLPKDFLPLLTWPKFFYRQQKEFVASNAWQTWFIGGNGTGKTLIVYWSDSTHLVGMHPNRLGSPPVKIKCLVPSFDNVEDVALEKLLDSQRIIYPLPATQKQEMWIKFLITQKALKDYDLDTGWIEVGPLLPHSMIIPKKGFSKDHKGIELKNGSSIWFSTSEQGWQAQRGGEQDILSIDEEGDERVTDECVRGLRNAKGGGKIIAGLTPPYMPGQGPTWTKEKVLEASLSDPDIHVVNACMADNPAITQEFIKRFSKGKTKKQVAVQVYGDYPAWGDLVHARYQDRLWDKKKIDGHLLPNDTPLPENFEVEWLMSFDWHQSKPCAAVFGYKDSDGNVVFFDELDKEWAEDKDIGDLCEAFFSLEGNPHHRRRFRRWQDPSAKHQYNAIKAGFNAWDAFRKEGVITAAGKNRDPEVGISIVNSYLDGNTKDSPRVFFYERMKYTRQYLGNHYWKRGEDGKGRPDPKWSDYPICVRYILQELGWKRPGLKKKIPYVSYEKADSVDKWDVSHLEARYR
jgi:hypothetical protein